MNPQKTAVLRMPDHVRVTAGYMAACCLRCGPEGCAAAAALTSEATVQHQRLLPLVCFYGVDLLHKEHV